MFSLSLFNLQVCKLLRHIAMSETLQVSAKFAEINLRIYGPQVVTAARTLAAHPSSAAARENLDVFVDMWAWLLADAARLARELLDLTDDRPDKQQYSSLPRPGVSCFVIIVISLLSSFFNFIELKTTNFLNRNMGRPVNL